MTAPSARGGLAAGIGAYLLWGMFPLYWPLLKPSGAPEILAHRILWSLLFVGAVVAAGRRWKVLRLLSRRQVLILSVAGALLALNWGVYIHGVNTGHVVETSLGYFINPLVMIGLGVVLLGERLRAYQWAAVALGTVAVVVLAVDYGRPPWLALVLAGTFAAYGLLKKRSGVPAFEGLTIEGLTQALPALIFLAWLQSSGSATFGAYGTGHAVLLILTGAVSAVPLLLFGFAALRVPLSTLGLLQYLAPMMQFLLGTLWFGEQMPPARWAGFALVWLALAILVAGAVRDRPRERQR